MGNLLRRTIIPNNFLKTKNLSINEERLKYTKFIPFALIVQGQALHLG
jgi:hypothetical protein